MRDAVVALVQALAAKGLPLLLYEGWRDPRRQAELYARGRVDGIGSPGKHVTRAQAWKSLHQYGLAADFVFFVAGKWTWQEPTRGAWATYQQIATALGLEVLSFEKPHVQLRDVSLGHLVTGQYPIGGDESWAANLDAAILSWGPLPRMAVGLKHPGAPAQTDRDDRPELEA